MVLVFCCGKSFFFGHLQLIFFKISGCADFRDLYHCHDVPLTATLFTLQSSASFSFEQQGSHMTAR